MGIVRLSTAAQVTMNVTSLSSIPKILSQFKRSIDRIVVNF